MKEPGSALSYIGYVRQRWQFVALTCATALALTAAITLMLPRKYTATARIVIEPPAGTDLRAAMAVSPIYLESLRTYEQFASGDRLFRDALERFQLRAGGTFESLKKQMLRTAIVRNTRVLEIAVTLRDPRKAQAMAQYLAEQTAAMNRTLIDQGDRDLLASVDGQRREARAQLDAAQAAWSQAVAKEPLDGLKSAVESASALRGEIEQQTLNAQLEIADAEQRMKSAAPGERGPIQQQEAEAKARLRTLSEQKQAVERQASEREALLAARLAKQNRLESERKAAEAAWIALDRRALEARNEAGYRGERLKVIDPGIVPERPSSPNTPLNLAIALVLGVVAPMAYLALEMNR